MNASILGSDILSRTIVGGLETKGKVTVAKTAAAAATRSATVGTGVLERHSCGRGARTKV